MLGLPTEFWAGQSRASYQSAGVAWAAWRCRMRHRLAGDPRHHVDDFAYRGATPCTQIDGAERAGLAGGERQHMGFGQIHHMNIISDTGAIGRGPVESKDLQLPVGKRDSIER